MKMNQQFEFFCGFVGNGQGWKNGLDLGSCLEKRINFKYILNLSIIIKTAISHPWIISILSNLQ
jgi:hypothetical protein